MKNPDEISGSNGKRHTFITRTAWVSAIYETYRQRAYLWKLMPSEDSDQTARSTSLI